jgi:hypothetical protein
VQTSVAIEALARRGGADARRASAQRQSGTNAAAALGCIRLAAFAPTPSCFCSPRTCKSPSMPTDSEFVDRFRELSDNRATLPGLIATMADGVVPFVDASLTYELGLPSLTSFVANLMGRHEIPSTVDPDRDFDRLRGAIGELYVDDQLVAELGNHMLPMPILGAIALVPYLTRDCAITTTVSQSLEMAFQQARQAFASVLWTDDDLATLGTLATPRLLIKLFGDVYDHPSQYLATAGAEARLAKASLMLTDFLMGRSLLFLSRDLLSETALDALAPSPPVVPQHHYALLPEAQRTPHRIRALYSRRIRPVWYPDEPGGFSSVLGYLLLRNPHPHLGVPSESVGKSEQRPADSTWLSSVTSALGAITASSAPVADPLAPVSVPSELVAACSRNECIAFVGSGLSARAGLPTWLAFVDGMLDQAVKAHAMTARQAETQRAALHDGEVNAVADNVVNAFATRPEELIEYYRLVSTTTLPLPRAFTMLRDIPFAGVLTSNYDNLLDRAYFDSNVERALTPADSDTLLELLATRARPFVLKLYGDLARPDTLLLAPNHYQTLVRSNAPFARFIESLFFSRTLLFLGVSLDGLTDYLSAFAFPSGIPRPHYALVAVSGKGWPAKAELLKRQYNISVMPFAQSADFPEVDTFLAELQRSVLAAPSANEMAARGPTATTLAAVRRLTLRDIGPFTHLDLDFSEQRTVLLGDNGVGKSSILRAIAVAIVGSDARHFAGRLIRSGQPSGSITLATAKNPTGYVTEVQRVGSGADVVSLGGRPLENENWAALGFPPLRTSSAKPLKGPQGMIARRPSVDDLLPLITGDIDVRMDDLKQWLVNTESIVASRTSSDDERRRATALKERFFEIVRTLTDDPVLELEDITADYQVLVKTRDGVVSIELLSQGMSSLLSWVGILVQRLYEVHFGNENVTDPTHEYALVLMDEIDAHMHPRWQQQLMDRLTALFPRIQIIASTHSPLVVAGMPARQVVRLQRAGDAIVAAPIDADMTLGRTDQLLTGDLFGLDSTLALGEETETLLKEYEKLLSMSDRTPQEQRRYHELVRLIGPRLPSASAENKLERRAHQLVQTILTADYSPEKLTELRTSLVGATREVAKSLGLEREA